MSDQPTHVVWVPAADPRPRAHGDFPQIDWPDDVMPPRHLGRFNCRGEYVIPKEDRIVTSCPDCPDLDRHPGDIQPRARCCRDEHLDRRMAGQGEGWISTARARALSLEAEARDLRIEKRRLEDEARHGAPLNRRARRAAAAKERRA